MHLNLNLSIKFPSHNAISTRKTKHFPDSRHAILLPVVWRFKLIFLVLFCLILIHSHTPDVTTSHILHVMSYYLASYVTLAVAVKIFLKNEEKFSILFFIKRGAWACLYVWPENWNRRNSLFHKLLQKYFNCLRKKNSFTIKNLYFI